MLKAKGREWTEREFPPGFCRMMRGKHTLMFVCLGIARIQAHVYANKGEHFSNKESWLLPGSLTKNDSGSCCFQWCQQLTSISFRYVITPSSEMFPLFMLSSYKRHFCMVLASIYAVTSRHGKALAECRTALI